jgi:hypothetical protein
MATIFEWFFKGYKKVYGIVIGASVFFFYSLIKKSSKLEVSNENLKTNLEELNIEAEKIVTIQRKQMDIASQPSISRDNIHKWMYSAKDVGPK